MQACAVLFPVVTLMQCRPGQFSGLATPLLARVLVRSVILCAGYFAFVLSIAAMPIANSVAIYFTMPFFVAARARALFRQPARIVPHLPTFAGVFWGAALAPARRMRRSNHHSRRAR